MTQAVQTLSAVAEPAVKDVPAGQVLNGVHVAELGSVVAVLNEPASQGVQVWFVDTVPATKIF